MKWAKSGKYLRRITWQTILTSRCQKRQNYRWTGERPVQLLNGRCLLLRSSYPLPRRMMRIMNFLVKTSQVLFEVLCATSYGPRLMSSFWRTDSNKGGNLYDRSAHRLIILPGRCGNPVRRHRGTELRLSGASEGKISAPHSVRPGWRCVTHPGNIGLDRLQLRNRPSRAGRPAANYLVCRLLYGRNSDAHLPDTLPDVGTVP